MEFLNNLPTWGTALLIFVLCIIDVSIGTHCDELRGR
jgi:hypothetical protein